MIWRLKDGKNEVVYSASASSPSAWAGTVRVAADKKNAKLAKIVKLRYLQIRRSGDEDAWEITAECVGQKLASQRLSCNVELYTPAFLQNDRQKANKEKVVRSPMTGKILRVSVAEGDTVQQGQELVVVEAMKMENRIFAPKAGTVKKLNVKPLQNIGQSDEICRIS